MSAQPFPPPRIWLQHPDDFGHAANPQWKTAQSDRDAMLLRGAQTQHQAVRRLRNRLTSQAGPTRHTVPTIAVALQIHPDTINKALGGWTHLSLTLLDAIAHTLGVTTAQIAAPAPPVATPQLTPSASPSATPVQRRR